MKKFSFSQTLKSGILVLIPAIIIFMLVEQLIGILFLLADPFDATLPKSYILAGLMVIGAVVVAIFIAGLASKSRFVTSAANFIEDKILSLIPGYNLVRQMAHSKLDASEASNWPAVLIEEGSGYVIGVIIEELGNKYATVYVPIAPQGFSGITRVVPMDSLLRIPGKDAGDVIDLCIGFGEGSAELVDAVLKHEKPDQAS